MNRCPRCGALMNTGGCSAHCAQRGAAPLSDPTWPAVRRLVRLGHNVPARMVRELLLDYDRLRSER